MKDLASTKVIVTLGPASAGPAVLRRLVHVGVDVFRLNCSHSSHEELDKLIHLVRHIEKETGVPLGIMGDLRGPKMRVGELDPAGFRLRVGEEVVLTPAKRCLTSNRIPITYSRLAADVSVKDSILLNDGLFELRVQKIEGKSVRCKVVTGGILTSNKGLNLPHAHVSAPALSTKDRADARFLLERGVDILALSFVRTAANVRSLRRLMEKVGVNAFVISKIEKPQAFHELDAILRISDGIMVARGDLGVEMDPEQVPILQKKLIRAANHHGKIVITATQMLESMIDNPRPTRAEATDVANAVFDGTDAVMLSGETAVGRYPVESARMMHEILREAEDSPFFDRHRIGVLVRHSPSVSSAIAQAAVLAAEKCNAHAIAVFTISGYTTRLIAKQRPSCAVIGLTPNVRTARTLSMAWGVTPILTQFQPSVDEALTVGKRVLMNHPLVGPGKRVLLVSGSNIEHVNNLIQIVQLDRE